MKLVDTSSGRQGPETTVEVAPGIELLMLPPVLLADDPHESFELDPGHLAALQAACQPDLLDELRAVVAGDTHMTLALAASVLDVDPPRDAAALLDVLRVADPVELTCDTLWLVDSDRLRAQGRAALDGDDEARDALLAFSREESKDEICRSRETVLARGAVQHHARLLAVLERLAAEVLPEVADDATRAIERDAAAKRALLESEPTLTAIEKATNGYRPMVTDELQRLVLIPSYLFRPWLATLDDDPTNIVLAYPVSDESIELDPHEPSPQLVRLVKALGDEGRLRLLRRLADEPLSLTEVAESMGVAKPTAHHHVSLLRQAGLVTVQSRGRESCYSLRAEPAATASSLLTRYLEG